MKRVIACIAVATVTTSVAVSPVQAAAADPVTVLKSRFAVGKGVKFTDVTTLLDFTGNTSFLRRTGSFQFGRAGIVASDTSAKRTADGAEIPLGVSWIVDKPERTIRIGTTSYYSGGVWAPPKGKTWIKHPHGMNAGFSGWYSQLVNVAEPATLKALITKGKRTGRTYSGAISFGALEKISPWMRNVSLTRLSGESKTAVLRFRLTLGSDQLPQRLVTVYPGSTHVSAAVGEDRQLSVETRYTGWGSRVTVKAPPASKVENMGNREPTVRGGGRG
ncbi:MULTISPECIES: hypothetical protein [unclassified Streptosporangium]|uniref:hypothetical protein n=1 Tax=unclassified Streptosporangium TaxID=2632669 RepID=UPI002E2AB7B3|nr:MULTISPECIES: hypothetical protein [unclassified Streptosporangium]